VTARTPIQIGVKGRYRSSIFVVRGRLRLRHTSGATWDEWYVIFEDKRKAWVAAASRRAFVTFEVDGVLPSFRSLIAGKRPWPAYVVLEKGRARYEAAEGRLPFEPRLGASYAYADLVAPSGAFATIDYSEEPPRLFVGEAVPLETLRIEPSRAAVRKRRRT
jgi:hypothetical protein